VTVSAKVEGLASLRAKMLRLAGPEGERGMRVANERNAKEFTALVARIIPRGDPSNGNLVSTLRQYSPGGIAQAVEIGGPNMPYPLHLEAGHRMPDGSHVPGKPFWNPAKRVLAKKAKGRAVRAERAAIKAITGNGGKADG
jgi:hypothetical protein